MFYEVFGLMSVASCGAGIYYCYSQGQLTPENVEKYMDKVDKSLMDCGEKFVQGMNKLINEFDNFMSRELNGSTNDMIIEDVSYSPQSPASTDCEETPQENVAIPLLAATNVSSDDDFIVLDDADKKSDI